MIVEKATIWFPGRESINDSFIKDVRVLNYSINKEVVHKIDRVTEKRKYIKCTNDGSDKGINKCKGCRAKVSLYSRAKNLEKEDSAANSETIKKCRDLAKTLFSMTVGTLRVIIELENGEFRHGFWFFPNEKKIEHWESLVPKIKKYFSDSDEKIYNFSAFVEDEGYEKFTISFDEEKSYLFDDKAKYYRILRDATKIEFPKYTKLEKEEGEEFYSEIEEIVGIKIFTKKGNGNGGERKKIEKKRPATASGGKKISFGGSEDKEVKKEEELPVRQDGNDEKDKALDFDSEENKIIESDEEENSDPDFDNEESQEEEKSNTSTVKNGKQKENKNNYQKEDEDDLQDVSDLIDEAINEVGK